MPVHPYFAYGSNMHAGLLMKRLERPDCEGFKRRRGILQHHTLTFSKRSSTDRRIGYASVATWQGETVEGVLNDVEETDLRRLDEIEIVPIHYTRGMVDVLDVGNGRWVRAYCYFGSAELTADGLLPTAEYIDRLLGGRDILSERYVSMLASVRTA